MGENSIKMDNVIINDLNRSEGNIFIDDIYWERVQMYIKGRLGVNISIQGNFQFYNIKTEQVIPIKHVQMKGNEFTCRFNVSAVDGKYLLPGTYQLLYITKEGRYHAQISQNLLNVNEQLSTLLEQNNLNQFHHAKNDDNYLLKLLTKDFRKNGNSTKHRYTVTPEIDPYTNDMTFKVSYINFKSKKSSKKRKFSLRRTRRRWWLKTREGIFNAIFNTSKFIHTKKTNTVLFSSESRSNLSGNFKFIYDEMLRQHIDKKYKIHQIYKANITDRYKFADKFKLAYLYGKADIIFVDDFHPTLNKVKFRPSQDIIQVWHAVGAFKTVGYSRAGKKGGLFFGSKAHRNYTKVYVSSKSVIPMYAEAFGMDESQVIATGVPRTDILFDESYAQQIKEKMSQELPIIKGKKVVLFAPTFRGNGHKTAHYPFDNIDFDRLATYCRHHNAVVLFKMHPFVKEQVPIPTEYQDYFRDIADYREVNDLLFITDILITDYSSLIYEFACFKRPMLFYAFDLEDYISSRDFYEPYVSFVPGKIVRQFDEVMHALEHNDFDIDKVKTFLDKNFDYQDGLASQRLVNDVFNRHTI